MSPINVHQRHLQSLLSPRNVHQRHLQSLQNVESSVDVRLYVNILPPGDVALLLLSSCTVCTVWEKSGSLLMSPNDFLARCRCFRFSFSCSYKLQGVRGVALFRPRRLPPPRPRPAAARTYLDPYMSPAISISRHTARRHTIIQSSRNLHRLRAATPAENARAPLQCKRKGLRAAAPKGTVD